MTYGARKDRRSSGVLLHPTSLPGPGVGDLGPAAYEFVDWLVEAEQTYWQILPLVPVDGGGSPYNGLSAMAGNPLLISPHRLERDGWIEAGWRMPDVVHHSTRVDYPLVAEWKAELLTSASGSVAKRMDSDQLRAIEAYRTRNGSWLSDYALFRALRDHYRGAPWSAWPPELRLRDPVALERWRDRLAAEIDRFVLEEFIFDEQWNALRDYANSRGVRIIGDIPIFVAYDSADVWAHQEIFELDSEGRPTVVSGVPPDYFSPTGQRWGNPIYRWDVLAAQGYDWWVERFRRTFELVDVARIDHFRGFESLWEIPVDEVTAIHGRWVPGPGAAFFRAIEGRLGDLPLLAEDLGLITPEVDRLRAEVGFPGMRVLQFAFDGDPRNPHLPQNYPATTVAYTGTHDNTTIEGWWAAADSNERSRVRRWLHEREPGHWNFIDAVLSSRAEIAIIPMQDVLGLTAEARMNTPGQPTANWTWRISAIPPTAVADHLAHLTRQAKRARGRDADSGYLDQEARP